MFFFSSDEKIPLPNWLTNLRCLVRGLRPFKVAFGKSWVRLRVGDISRSSSSLRSTLPRTQSERERRRRLGLGSYMNTRQIYIYLSNLSRCGLTWRRELQVYCYETLFDFIISIFYLPINVGKTHPNKLISAILKFLLEFSEIYLYHMDHEREHRSSLFSEMYFMHFHSPRIFLASLSFMK